jgi:hypothetical protein
VVEGAAQHGVTLFGIFLAPAFFYVVDFLTGRRQTGARLLARVPAGRHPCPGTSSSGLFSDWLTCIRKSLSPLLLRFGIRP